MATFANGESGLSVRTKINDVLQHADGTAGGLVINDAGADVDFRVESDTVANALFVDGATGNVGLGTSTPTNYRTFGYGSTIEAAGGSGGTFLVSNGAYTVVTALSNASSAGVATGGVLKTNTSHPLSFGTADTERMRIDASGRLLIGTTSASGANLLQVNSDATINGFTVGRGAGGVSSNSVLGFNALLANTTGASNTAVGRDALQKNTTGNANTAVGRDALLNSVSGDGNTSIGANTLQFCTGLNNTAIGYGAGYNLTTGSNNTIIGAVQGTAGLANTVIIGAGATERLRIDSNGNVGLSAAPSAWNTIRAIQVGFGASFSGGISFNDAFIASNAIYDGAWRYINTGYSAHHMSVGGDAATRWYTAPSGTAGNAITFTQAMTLDASGNLMVGTTAAAGTASNAAVVVNGGTRTATGTVSATTAVATTIFSITAGNRGRYEVVAMISSTGEASIYAAFATVIWDGVAGRIVANNGSALTLTLSGANVQTTQTSGSLQTVSWSFQRIAL